LARKIEKRAGSAAFRSRRTNMGESAKLDERRVRWITTDPSTASEEDLEGRKQETSRKERTGKEQDGFETAGTTTGFEKQRASASLFDEGKTISKDKRKVAVAMRSRREKSFRWRQRSEKTETKACTWSSKRGPEKGLWNSQEGS